MGVVKGQDHSAVSPVSNWSAFFLFHINQITIPYMQLFWNLILKIQGQGSFHVDQTMHTWDMSKRVFDLEQGKSEGFESCDRPIVRKCAIWVKIGDVSSRVTLKFDGWPWKTIGHLSFAVSSFVEHFIAIGDFKLDLQSGNTQFGSNSTIFRAVWPWNLTDDLEKQ